MGLLKDAELKGIPEQVMLENMVESESAKMPTVLGSFNYVFWCKDVQVNGRHHTTNTINTK